MIEERAYAKLNVTLEVLRKRADGYHELASIMQTVNLHDTLSFAAADGIGFACSDASLADDDNLVVRAAHLMRARHGVTRGAAITLTKRIPVAAGLGGGSADAAAALRGLNRLWDLRLPGAELSRLASALGSDVAFLVRGGTALVGGRGDVLEPLPTPRIPRIVIVTPRVDGDASTPNKTARMFGMIESGAFTTGSLTRKLAARMRGGGDCHAAFMFNAFQRYAPHAFPGWQSAYDAFVRLGASDVVLSGAGPSMFAVPPSREVATAWALLIKARTGCEAFAGELAPPIDVDAAM